MSDTKHTPTPGPWEWSHSDSHPGRGSISEIVSQESGDLIVSLVNDRGESYSDAAAYAANARLIAAAPTMLEALKLARTEIAWWVGEHECCEGKETEAMAKINAAIALAEGGAK